MHRTQLSTWDDSIDWASLEMSSDSNDTTSTMTTWHENDTPNEIAHFFLHCTAFDNNVFHNFLVLSIGRNESLLLAIKRECMVA